MKRLSTIVFSVFTGWLIQSAVLSADAKALEVDWSGQFWSEFNWVHDYAMDSSGAGTSVDQGRSNRGGYYAPGGGSRDATFQNLFLRLRPKVVVNDNIYLKTEIWFGDPIYGLFGSSLPYTADETQYNTTFSRGAPISAQRFWGEFVTDIGTFQAGRIPLDWGLGVVWNPGENLWSRYMSTGDAIRWLAKFGAFTLAPSFIVPTTGNTIGGVCSVFGGSCTPGLGSGGVTDYSLILKYESAEDGFEGGLNLIRRLGGAGGNDQIVEAAFNPGSMNYITYDLFFRKSFDRLTLSAELPIVSGSVGSARYEAFAIATETDWKLSDSVNVLLKAGYAPGQQAVAGTTVDNYRAFYFHPNYHIAQIMFNYQLANFAGPQTLNNPGLSQSALKSPYDNPIVNAAYFSWGVPIKAAHKWTLKPTLTYAYAPRSANSGDNFFNYWSRTVQTNTTGINQGNSLGWEFDFSVQFQWDEYFLFSFDNGIFFPGNFYAFSNTVNNNATSPVIASSVRVGVSF